ncbi:hypothetical protein KCU78_g5212, partial [Aureobasidium melanogenum]
MAPKHSLDAAMGWLPAAKRARSTTSIVKEDYRANFDRLCALHNWTPSEAVREKLAAILQISGQRLKASELLPLAFVQHYPFIWVEDFLLLSYNDADESVWYKAFPTGRGMARGRYYNSAQVKILGKHTVTKFWQSWIDVFDIEQRGLDRCHDHFTGVYLILKKFPNLRYKSGKSKGYVRDPQNATRATGIAEYPFNDDHPFMQEPSRKSTSRASAREIDPKSSSHTTKPTSNIQIGPNIEDDIPASIFQEPKTPTSRGPLRTLKTITSPYFARTKSQSTQPKVLELPRCDSILSQPSQMFREYTLRVPVEEPKWSNTNFKFAAVSSVSIAPGAPVMRSIKD